MEQIHILLREEVSFRGTWPHCKEWHTPAKMLFSNILSTMREFLSMVFLKWRCVVGVRLLSALPWEELKEFSWDFTSSWEPGLLKRVTLTLESLWVSSLPHGLILSLLLSWKPSSQPKYMNCLNFDLHSQKLWFT